MLNNTIQPCYCGSGEKFESCCGKFISFKQYPETAEQLMRSRYSAYVIKNENYLLKSWHESTRPDNLNLENDSTVWKKLKIISNSENSVHFVAYFTQDMINKEKSYALTEKSDFIKDTYWFYLSGTEVKTIELTKNMPCPCLSGKKFKRCCNIDL